MPLSYIISSTATFFMDVVVMGIVVMGVVIIVVLVVVEIDMRSAKMCVGMLQGRLLRQIECMLS